LIISLPKKQNGKKISFSSPQGVYGFSPVLRGSVDPLSSEIVPAFPRYHRCVKWFRGPSIARIHAVLRHALPPDLDLRYCLSRVPGCLDGERGNPENTHHGALPDVEIRDPVVWDNSRLPEPDSAPPAHLIVT